MYIIIIININKIALLSLHLRQQLRSIVMSKSVYVFVCLWGYLWNHTHNPYRIFSACCLWPWLGPPPAGWQNPKGKG